MSNKYEPDMTMETNHWTITNPKWNNKNAPRWKCTKDSHWYYIYGNDCFLQMSTNKTGRVLFKHYCNDEHFYYLYWRSGFNSDIIFASYDINEIIRFVKKLATKKHGFMYYM